MKPHDLPPDAAPIAFTLDGQPQEARPGETLLQVAQRVGVALPHLCHQERLGSPGNCRACVVEVQGERVLAPSCCRTPQPGMVVHTASDRAVGARRTVLELLLEAGYRPATYDNVSVHVWLPGKAGWLAVALA